MTAIITHRNVFPGSSINVNENTINLALGDKLLVDTGIINTIILGNWNRLVAGTSTVIQLGTKMKTTYANTVNLTYGNSWHYSASPSQTISDNDIRHALNGYNIFGGATENEQHRLWSENKQTFIILTGAIVSFFLLIGVSLLNIQAAPFKTVDNNNNNSTFDPSTGEIIDNSGSDITINTSIMALSSIIVETLSFVLTIFGQWLLAKTLTDNNNVLHAISALYMRHNQLLAQVTSYPSGINKKTKRKSPLRKLIKPSKEYEIISDSDQNAQSDHTLENQKISQLDLKSNELCLESTSDKSNYSKIKINNDSIQLESLEKAFTQSNIVLSQDRRQGSSITLASSLPPAKNSTIPCAGQIDLKQSTINFINSGEGIIEIACADDTVENNHEDVDENDSTTDEIISHNYYILEKNFTHKSALTIDFRFTGITTSKGHNGILVENNAINLFSQEKYRAWFSKNRVLVGKESLGYSNKSGTTLGDGSLTVETSQSITNSHLSPIEMDIIELRNKINELIIAPSSNPKIDEDTDSD